MADIFETRNQLNDLQAWRQQIVHEWKKRSVLSIILPSASWEQYVLDSLSWKALK